MTAGVSARVSLNINAKLTGANDLGTVQMLAQIEKSLEFSAGTASTGQANIMFSDQRTLAASATENLDLAGVLADAFGATIAAAEVVLIYISAATGNTNDVIVGGHASAAFVGPFGDATDKISIAPGDFVLLNCKRGWPVTATTADLIKIANSAGTTGVTYDVLIIGRMVAA